jgi:hypothetical protein
MAEFSSRGSPDRAVRHFAPRPRDPVRRSAPSHPEVTFPWEYVVWTRPI